MGQLASVRVRLNGLALQAGLFSSLALLLITSATIVFAAYFLMPVAFLAVSAAVTIGCLAGLFFALRNCWRNQRSAEHAAALADERAGMKGRLLTLAALQDQPNRSALWPYLVEDAMLRRDEFTPARIERQRISRWIFPLLASMILALSIAPLLSHRRGPLMLASANHQPLTLNLRDLNLDSSDHHASGNARLTGDPATLRKLAQMMAAARRREQNRNLLSKMMKSAHSLAGNLQDRITGRQNPPPMDLRLADNGGHDQNSAPPEDSNPPPSASNGPKSGDAGNPQDAPKTPATVPENEQQSSTPGSLAMQTPPSLPRAGQPQSGTNARQSANQQRSGGNDSGGASHGGGTDPQGLYGQPDREQKNDGNFQIAINANPGQSGHAGNHSYPPKINAPLNPDQHPDEPVGRAAVPAAERSTIRRIFDR
ncbi:MAG: hypothetical protein IVW54_03350 [Candidatus Binataceae bacterium]|nr:hypothetical protein [Candidatus Binataceae bacterium]